MREQQLMGAVRSVQAGDLIGAARACESLLASDPNDADACQLLGLIDHARGRSDRAIERIGRAVALRPGSAAFRANLAEAFRAAGQLERAADCCREALRIAPDYFPARINLGIALRELGDPARAAEQFQAVVAVRPDDAPARINLGTVLRDLGRLDAALAQFRQSVELSPDLEIGHVKLGQVLLDLGRPVEALPHFRRAVELNPRRADAHADLGYALEACGRFAEAIPCYSQALRLDPRLGRAHAGLGLALEREGRLDEAIRHLHRAVELEPGDFVFVCRLGEAYALRERHTEAIACYRKAIELKPERARSHGNLAWLVQQEGRVEEARRHYQIALDLEPRDPHVLINVGGLHEELGERDEAEASFRAALGHPVAHPVALSRLATLLRGELPDADHQGIQRCLTDPAYDQATRAMLLFGLAQVHDARGAFAEAGECLREANALALADNRRRHLGYDRADHERLVSGLIDAFGRETFARLAAAGAATRLPVFVFGLPRSGTSLVEQILASHPAVCGAGELILGRQDFDVLPALMNRAGSPLDCLADLDGGHVRRLVELHLGRLAERDGGRASRIVDKGNDNYLYLGMLAILFPAATFIHCRRDLRDVAASCWTTNFRSIRWANAVEDIAARFRQYRRVMDHWRAVLPAPILDVDYEAMVDNLEEAARRLVAACGLPWDPACLEFHRTTRQVRTSSHAQVRQPIYRKALGRWRNYEPHLAELFAALPT